MTTADDLQVDVSVIICVRNGEAVIGRQLAALDAQVDAPDFEVIVVDNGSSDGTAQVVRDWIAADGHAHERARLIEGPTRPGIPAARNAGLRAAAGRLVAFCDADDTVCTGWVAAMAAGVPEHGMAGGRVIAVDPDGTERPNTFPAGLRGDWLPFTGGGNMAAERAALLKVGGYDQSLPAYGYEDVDISWRFQLEGHPLVYVPGAEIRMTLSPPRRVIRKRFLLGVGRILMAARYPRYDPRPFSLGYCARQVVSDVIVLARVVAARRRQHLSPAARNLVQNTGVLAGYLKYHVLGRIPAPELLTGVGK